MSDGTLRLLGLLLALYQRDTPRFMAVEEPEATIHLAALQALKEACEVTLYSDSQYLVRMMRDGWPQRWRANGWKRKTGAALNPDLWEALLQSCEKHRVEFVWVRGHAGNPDNERCDRLLMHLFQHDIHHRGQAHAMLSATSVAPPQLDEFFAADEAPLRANEFAELGWTEEMIWRGK